MHNFSKESAEASKEWARALSRPRLSNYRTFFNAASDAEALGLYRWNEDISAAFFRLICLIEIILRNRFHHAMSMRYGAVGSQESRDWYFHVDLNPRSKAKIEEITHIRRGTQRIPRRPTRRPDDVISQLSFGFWPHLLDLAKDSLGNKVDWGPILCDLLPGHRQRQSTYWGKTKHQDLLFARLDLCNDIRNRIAHHEPIWKLGPLIDETRARPNRVPATLAPAPTTPDESLARLRLLYGRLVELLDWLNPSISRQYQLGHAHKSCNLMLDPKTLNLYKNPLPTVQIDLSRMKSLRALRKALRYAARRQQPVVLIDAHRMFGPIGYHR